MRAIRYDLTEEPSFYLYESRGEIVAIRYACNKI